jgi:hypothetical protein
MATRRSSSAFCWLLSSAHNAPHTSEHVLNRSALQRRASCAFKRPAAIRARRFAVTLGTVQRDGLRCAPTMCAYDVRLRCAQELILRVTLSFHMLAVALGPADRLDGRTLDVELLMTDWHRAFSLSIPIPIATSTPFALRRCLYSVV